MARRPPANRLSLGGCAIMLMRLLPAVRAETSSPEFNFIAPTRETSLPMGQSFTATWASKDQIANPSFQLCSTAALCGTSLKPDVRDNPDGTWSAELHMPNIPPEREDRNFFLRMIGESGTPYDSPSFNVGDALPSNASASATASMASQTQDLSPTNYATRLTDTLSPASISPTQTDLTGTRSNSVHPSVNVLSSDMSNDLNPPPEHGLSRSTQLAIALPISLLGSAVLLALALFCWRRKRGKSKRSDAGSIAEDSEHGTGNATTSSIDEKGVESSPLAFITSLPFKFRSLIPRSRRNKESHLTPMPRRRLIPGRGIGAAFGGMRRRDSVASSSGASIRFLGGREDDRSRGNPYSMYYDGSTSGSGAAGTDSNRNSVASSNSNSSIGLGIGIRYHSFNTEFNRYSGGSSFGRPLSNIEEESIIAPSRTTSRTLTVMSSRPESSAASSEETKVDDSLSARINPSLSVGGMERDPSRVEERTISNIGTGNANRYSRREFPVSELPDDVIDSYLSVTGSPTTMSSSSSLASGETVTPARLDRGSPSGMSGLSGDEENGGEFGEKDERRKTISELVNESNVRIQQHVKAQLEAAGVDGNTKDAHRRTMDLDIPMDPTAAGFAVLSEGVDFRETESELGMGWDGRLSSPGINSRPASALAIGSGIPSTAPLNINRHADSRPSTDIIPERPQLTRSRSSLSTYSAFTFDGERSIICTDLDLELSPPMAMQQGSGTDSEREKKRLEEGVEKILRGEREGAKGFEDGHASMAGLYKSFRGMLTPKL